MKEVNTHTGSAPARMDVMGGIADYSGSLLLQMPMPLHTTVRLKKREDRLFRISSTSPDGSPVHFQFNYDIPEGISLGEAGKRIRQLDQGDWAVYVLGCFVVLALEKSLTIQGADMEVQSGIPWGKGLSSSAALEVATLRAICSAYGLSLGDIELAVLAQRVENQVVGAACGLMDQLAVHCGKPGMLLPIVCQPHAIYDPVAIPAALHFAGIDSGVRHAVGAASYGDVRTAAFMAYSIVALEEGATRQELQQAHATGDWSHLPFKGYLSNIDIETFEGRFAAHLPDTLDGEAFLAEVGVSIDRATAIDPNKEYHLLVAAEHPVYEHARVERFLSLLQDLQGRGLQEEILIEMGDLMYQSHMSYSAVGLGNEHTDAIVGMVMEAGPEQGLYGARISGGGSGGTVVVMSAGDIGQETLHNLFDRYQKSTKMPVRFFGV